MHDPAIPRSSAGNTRGLIEASAMWLYVVDAVRLPRGIPAASLKLVRGTARGAARRGLPRGIPAASLKRRHRVAERRAHRVFRGEYPRPH